MRCAEHHRLTELEATITAERQRVNDALARAAMRQAARDRNRLTANPATQRDAA